MVTAGGTVYYYILGEYRVSNEMLTEDIYVCFVFFLPALRLLELASICLRGFTSLLSIICN